MDQVGNRVVSPLDIICEDSRRFHSFNGLVNDNDGDLFFEGCLETRPTWRIGEEEDPIDILSIEEADVACLLLWIAVAVAYSTARARAAKNGLLMSARRSPMVRDSLVTRVRATRLGT
jgi:hypothetical protein